MSVARSLYPQLKKSIKTIGVYYLLLVFFAAASAFLELKTEVKPLSLLGSLYINGSNDSCEQLSIERYNKGVVVDELPFTPANVACLKRELKNKEWLLVFVSPGGSSMSARHLVEYINNNNIRLHVEYMCVSACVEILSSVNNSSAGEALFLADHKGEIAFPPPFSFLFYPLDVVFNWVSDEMLIKAGIPSHEVERITRTTELTEVPNNKLVSLGFVNKITNLADLTFYQDSTDLDEEQSKTKPSLFSPETEGKLIKTSSLTLFMVFGVIFTIAFLLVLVARMKRPMS